jgi:hypothetical protein
MINRVRNAHAWAALLLLAAACDSGGGGGDDKEDSGRDGAVLADAETDGEAPAEDGGDEDTGIEEEDAGDDAGDPADTGTDPMDGDTPDTGTTTDTGTGDTDSGGSDAGTDAGPTLPANCAETAIVAGTGGSVTSTDTRFQLTLAGGQLSADSTVRVCVIAAATAIAGADGRSGDAYEITTSPAATFAAATATFRGHGALPAVDATTAFDPLIVRALPAGGTLANGTSAVLRLSKRTLAADTVSTLTATVAGPGHVFVAPLEAPGVYSVDMRTPTKTAFVTGEVIDFSTIVTVTGTPAAARIFEAEINGCGLDPINYASVVGDVPQPAAVTNHPSCAGANYVAITRRGGPAISGGTIVGGTAAGGAALAGGTTLDLRAHDSTPLGLYCRYPGAGKGAARLFFKTGATTNLEVVKDIEVTCASSGDWIAIYDQVDITRGGANDYVIGTTYTPRSYIAIAPPAITYTTVAPDAVRFAEPAAVLSGAGAVSTFSAVADYQTGVDPAPIVHNATNTVTFTYATDRYTAALTTPTPGFFDFRARADLHIREGGSTLFDCYPPALADLGLQLGNRAGAASTVSTLDGTIDVVDVRARFPAASPATVVHRVVDATRLMSHQAVPFFTNEQRTALASLGAASEYAVGFFRIAWDEQRRLWDGGRVLPVACGTVLLFEAADVAP